MLILGTRDDLQKRPEKDESEEDLKHAVVEKNPLISSPLNSLNVGSEDFFSWKSPSVPIA